MFAHGASFRTGLPQPIRSSVRQGTQRSPCYASQRESSRRPSLSVPISPGGPRLVSRVDFTRTPPFTLIYHIRPEAHWSDGRPDHARGTSCSPYHAILKHGSHRLIDTGPRFAPSECPGCQDRQGRTAIPIRRLAGALREHPPTARATWGGPAQRVEESHRQPQDRRSNRERPLPRRALGAWQADHASSKPELLGAASCVPRPTRRPLRRQRRRSGRLGSGPESSTSLPRSSAELFHRRPARARPKDIRVPRHRAGSTLEIRVGAGGHPALRSKLVRRALAFGIDRGRSRRGRCSGTSTRKLGSATVSSTRLRVLTIGRTGVDIATAPRRRVGCSSSRDVGEGPTASMPARGNDSRSASWLLSSPVAIGHARSSSYRRNSNRWVLKWYRSLLRHQ